MQINSLFVSRKFDDPNANNLFVLTRNAAANIRGIKIVDGRSLHLKGGFADVISKHIKRKASCLVALFTSGPHRNENVILEVGIALGSGKPVILVAQSLDDVPSMLKHLDVLTADTNRLDWPQTLTNELERKLREFFQSPENHVVEAKLARRYSAEELRHFKNAGRFRTVIAAIRSADLDKAEAQLDSLRSRHIHDSDIMFLLADTYYLKGCALEHPEQRKVWFERQLQMTEHALTLDQSDVLALSARARGLLRMGRFTEAEAALTRLLKQDPLYSIGHYDLACVKALTANKNEMMRCLKSAIDIEEFWKEYAKSDPDFADYWDDNDWRELIY